MGPGERFHYGGDACPNADRAVRRNLGLPIHRGATGAGPERMADIVEAHAHSGAER